MKYLETILCLGVLLIAVIGMSYLPTAWAVERVNTDTQGLAIKGYDPVAYFNQGKPLKGTEKFTCQWMGAEWRFASAEHLDLFKSNPEKYAPQYGGYWAYRIAMGHIAKGDPTVWKIVEGKLYLNCRQEIMKKWEQDIPGYIEKANKNWPSVLE